jgi:hypothetical protein
MNEQFGFGMADMKRELREKQQAEPVWELGVAGRLSAEPTALAGCEGRS